MKRFLKWLKHEKNGQGLVEYALIIGLVALVVIVGVALFGTNLSEWWNGLAGTVDKSL